MPSAICKAWGDWVLYALLVYVCRCMKVILLQDVARIGRKNEIQDVPDGHAQNYLIPRKLAEPATEQNVQRVTKRAQQHAARDEADRTAFDDFYESLHGEPVVIAAEANAKGHLFKGVRADDIRAALVARGAPEAIVVSLARPIKERGEHTIALTVGGEERMALVRIEAA